MTRRHSNNNTSSRINVVGLTTWCLAASFMSRLHVQSFLVTSICPQRQRSAHKPFHTTSTTTTTTSTVLHQGLGGTAPGFKSSKSSNAWGIPYSSDLPPLATYDTSQRIPDHLPNGATVTLLGSGPGDPELLTVAAYKLLTTNNHNTLVIADRLVSAEILQLCHEAQIPVQVARKLPGCAELAQEEIYWWTYQALNQGKHVIRLKIGDPFVFGRGGEEVLTFRRFGLQPKVIPGVSAAFSAPLLGGIPVTHRGVANQVVMCTGYGREGTSPDLIRYHEEQTIVFLMAVGRLRDLCAKLIQQAGYPSDTPVGIIEKAGCPDQRTVVGTMETIGDLADQYQIQPPSTIVVGKVVNVLLEHDHTTGQTVTGLIHHKANYENRLVLDSDVVHINGFNGVWNKTATN